MKNDITNDTYNHDGTYEDNDDTIADEFIASQPRPTQPGCEPQGHKCTHERRVAIGITSEIRYDPATTADSASKYTDTRLEDAFVVPMKLVLADLIKDEIRYDNDLTASLTTKYENGVLHPSARMAYDLTQIDIIDVKRIHVYTDGSEQSKISSWAAVFIAEDSKGPLVHRP